MLMARPWNMADRLNLSAFGTSRIPGTIERIGAGVVDNLAEAARFLDDLETHEREISGNSLLQKRVTS